MAEPQSKEFVSKVEEIKPAKELNFDATPGFGHFRVFFPEEALGHPAKMNTRLLEYLVTHYTKKGDVVLDPMAGTGSTGVVAALHGRNAICVELEEKFVRWAEKAKARVDGAPTINQKGQLKIIQGDARKLSELLGRVDEVITSPPYTNEPAENPNITMYRKGGEFPIEKGITYSKENISNLPHGDVDSIITSPPYSDSYLGSGDEEKRKERLIKSGHDPKDFLGGKARNAALEHYSEADVIITSPPYSEGQFDYKHGIKPENFSPNMKGRKTFIERRKMEYSENNITNLKHGDIDAVITSPPYSETFSASKVGKAIRTGETKIHDEKHLGRSYTSDLNEKNIGNLKHGSIDTVITSPPYESSLEGSTRHTRGGIASRDPAMAQKGTYATTLSFGVPVGYSSNSNNIGNMKKETYLGAMFQVYRQMYSVLKSGGRAVIVIKPFVRHKSVIDLPYQTLLLLEKIGFKLMDVLKLRLQMMSFWRILYYRKHTEVPVIAHEYILVVEKL